MSKEEELTGEFDKDEIKKTVDNIESSLKDLSKAKLITEGVQDLNTSTEEESEPKPSEGSDDSDSGWDTDLECPDEHEPLVRRESFDLAGKLAYKRACQRLNVTPISSLLHNFENKQISLAHHGIGPQGAKALAIGLVKSTTVEKLDLEENSIGEDGAGYFAKMLRENCYISELNLAGNCLNSRGAMAMAEVMAESRYVRSLDLSFNNFIDKDASCLAHGLSMTSILRHLRLSHNSFSELGGELLAPGIAGNYSVETLDLSWNHLRRKGAIAICKAMSENSTIQILDLSWNGFADDGAAAMGRALRNNNTLKELDLSHNRITRAGAFELAKGLAVNDTLRVLKIGFNPIGSEGTFALLKAMKNNAATALEELHLNNITVGKHVMDFLDDYLSRHPNFQISLGTNPSDRRRDDYEFGADRVQTKHQLLMILKNYLIEKRYRAVDLFNCLDKDKSRTVSPEELYDGLKKVQIPLDDAQLKRLIRLLDKDGDGMIDYSEFAAVNS